MTIYSLDILLSWVFGYCPLQTIFSWVSEEFSFPCLRLTVYCSHRSERGPFKIHPVYWHRAQPPQGLSIHSSPGLSAYSPSPSLTLALFSFLFSASPPMVLCPLPFPGMLPGHVLPALLFSSMQFISSPSSRLGPDLTWCANHSGWKSDSLALCPCSQHPVLCSMFSLYTYHHLSVSVTHYTCLTDCLKQFKNGGDPGMEPTRMSTSRGKDKADAAHTYNGIVVVVPKKGQSELEGGLGWRPKERGWRAESHSGWGDPGVGRDSTGRLSSPCDSISWVPAFTSLFSGSVRAEDEDWVVRSIKCLQWNLHQCLLGTQRWTGRIRDTVGLCLTCTSPGSQWMKFVTEKTILSCHVWRNT